MTRRRGITSFTALRHLGVRRIRNAAEAVACGRGLRGFWLPYG